MTTSNSTQPAVTWGVDARSVASLLIFIHLFVVLAAAVGYNSRPSGMQERLHSLFAAYLRPLHLTPVPASFPFARFHLTHGLPTSDIDFTIEAELTGRDGKQHKVLLPAPDIRPLVRYRRYQLLANATGIMADNELIGADGNLFPRDIGAALLHEYDAEQARVRVRAHYVPLRDPAARDEARREVLYEARVFLTDGTVELLRIVDKPEVAPVEPKPAAKPPGDAPPQGTNTEQPPVESNPQSAPARSP